MSSALTNVEDIVILVLDIVSPASVKHKSLCWLSSWVVGIVSKRLAADSESEIKSRTTRPVTTGMWHHLLISTPQRAHISTGEFSISLRLQTQNLSLATILNLT